MITKVLCVYHGNCADGFGGALVVKRYYDSVNLPITFLPAIYQKTQPPVVDKETQLVIVDFSFGFDETFKLIQDAGNTVLLDHHKSAIAKLAPLTEFSYSGILNDKRSGAMLAWNHYFPELAPPLLLRHIEDRDLWKFELHGTKEIQANLFSYPYDFDVWDDLMRMDAQELEIFYQEGEGILRKHFKDIHEFLNVSTRWMIIGGLDCPVTNVPYMWGSDAAHILAENAPNGFAAYYWDGPDGRTFGLRSIGDRDVSEIATTYGGGGHKNAAGFKITKDPLVGNNLLG